MEYPLEHKAGPGRYVVSVRLTNPGYSQVVEEAFTFIKEKKDTEVFMNRIKCVIAIILCSFYFVSR